jgi:hypothetical protein
VLEGARATFKYGDYAGGYKDRAEWR